MTKVGIQREHGVKGGIGGEVALRVLFLLAHDDGLGSAAASQLQVQFRRAQSIIAALLLVLRRDGLHGEAAQLADQAVHGEVVGTHRGRQRQVPNALGILLQRPACALVLNRDFLQLLRLQGQRPAVAEVKHFLFQRRFHIARQGEDARVAADLGVQAAAGGCVVTQQQGEGRGFASVETSSVKLGGSRPKSFKLAG